MFGPGGPTFLELAQQALSSTDRGYDLLAPKFDRTPFRTPDEVIAVTLEALGEDPGIVLDLACGTGAAACHLKAQADVVGIDRSAGMLAEAQRRVAAAPGNGAVSLVRGDALALPFEGVFDAVVCFGAFGHILVEDEPRLVENVYRALKPGGRFAFVTAEPPPPWSLRWWVAHAFNAAMRVRNALFKPPFIMYYLTFLVPRARALLEAAGFQVEVRDAGLPPPWQRARIVIATRGRG
jgi:ubiquinone/menaquinone biosynthesis C-methylase UbiE